MDTPYYNLIPPLAQSEDLGPVSPGSSDSGVQDENPKPLRPPRAIDTPKIQPKLPTHSYINLATTTTNNNSVSAKKPSLLTNQSNALANLTNKPMTPPILPKRQPYLVQSPTLAHRNQPAMTGLQRSASAASVPHSQILQNGKKMANKRGICKCKVSSSNNGSNPGKTK